MKLKKQLLKEDKKLQRVSPFRGFRGSYPENLSNAQSSWRISPQNLEEAKLSSFHLNLSNVFDRIIDGRLENHYAIVEELSPHQDDNQNQPLFLMGSRAPNAEDRRNGRPKRKFYIPRKLVNLHQTKFTGSQASIISQNSEVKAACNLSYEVSVHTLKKLSGKQYLSILFWLYFRKDKEETPFLFAQEELLHHILKKAKSQQFNGVWGEILQLHQMSGSTETLQWWLETNYSETYQERTLPNRIKEGFELADNYIVIRFFNKNMVLHPNRKLGHAVTNSGSGDDTTHDTGGRSLMKKSEFDMEVKLFYTAIESNYLRELGNPIPTRITEFVTNLGEDLYNKYTEISNAISIKSEQKHRERYKEYFESIEPSEPVSIHCDLFDIWDWYGPPTEESILKSKRSKEDKKLILEKLTIYKNQK